VLEPDAARLSVAAGADHDEVRPLLLGQLGQAAGGRRSNRRALVHADARRDRTVARVREQERDLVRDHGVGALDVRSELPMAPGHDAGEG
jgi:hypothetical protein